MTCNMPNIEVLSNYMFSCCNNLYKVNVPNANDIGTSVFEYDKNGTVAKAYENLVKEVLQDERFKEKNEPCFTR